MKKLRITYALLFFLLLISEVLIGLYAHDDFVRPYLGDVLITVLLGCLVRTVFPKGIRLLPVYVMLFATLVEIAQYLQIIKLLGLSDNKFIATLAGTSFSWIDLVCYAVGCLAFWGTEYLIHRWLEPKNPK